MKIKGGECLQCEANYSMIGWKCVNDVRLSFNATVEVSLDKFLESYHSFKNSLTKLMPTNHDWD